MATVLENYYNLRGEVDQRIAKGGAPADAIWWHGEIVYRISVLETCQMFCKTAPITMEIQFLQGHYKMLDAYVLPWSGAMGRTAGLTLRRSETPPRTIWGG